MTQPLEIPAVSLLILVRLLPAGETGETRAKVDKDLKPLVQHRWEGSAWTERFDGALDALESAGLIARTRKGKAERFAATPEGRRNALTALGIDSLPPKTSWAKLKSPYLLAYVLGLPAADAKRLAGAGLKTELLRASYGLPAGTAKQVAESLAWKLMGFDPGPKFDAKNIQAALFRRELGDPDATAPLDLIAARSVGARRSQPAELSHAALRAWIDRSATAVAPLDLDDFARRVQEAARSSPPAARFGEHKVFISHIWRELRGDPAFQGIGPDEFKRRLGEANNAGRLELTRADLVEAMDRSDVRESETPYLNGVFHFVRI